MNGVEKYLARYAEPETALAKAVSARYGAVLVVPALGEAVELVEGYRDAARAVPGRVLVIVVVNARSDTALAFRERNHGLLTELRAGRWPELDLLTIDRSSPGRELPAKQGVGLARKIGMDVALALVARGSVCSPWLFGTDADAALPRDFFVRASSAPAGAGALVYPFAHAGGDVAVVTATLRYEVSLRYHVLGLAWAGSPYAYHSVGSAMVVNADAYAAVRGVPKREAGEDFYLLEKVAKVASIARMPGAPILIRARRSSRAPFGTGPAVSSILEHGDVTVAHPAAFAALGRLIDALDCLAEDRDIESFRRSVAALAPEAGSLAKFLEALGLYQACVGAIAAVGSGNLRRRLHTWFDGRRTLRVLHALRDRGIRDVALARALECAPFAPGTGGLDAHSLLARLVELEQRLPAEIGPSLLTEGREVSQAARGR